MRSDMPDRVGAKPDPAPSHQVPEPGRAATDRRRLLGRTARSPLAWRIAFAGVVTRLRAEPFSALLAEQDRWFLWLPVAMAAGVIIYFALPAEPMPVALWLGFAALAGAAWRVRQAILALCGLSFAAAVLLGAALASTQAHRAHAPAIHDRSAPVFVTGIVRDSDARDARGLRYRILVDEITGMAPERTPHTVTVTRRGGDAAVPIGHRVRLRAILLPPPDAAAPGGFDYARRAYLERIGGTGFALGTPEDLGPAKALSVGLRIAVWLDAVRSAVEGRIRTALPGREGGIAAALIVGKRGGIPEASREALRAAGLAHILAISGLHMALVAGSVFLGARLLLAAIPGLALRWPIRKIAALAGLFAACCYLGLSGASVSAQRAFIMAAVMFVAMLLDRPAITLRNVAIAAIVIIVVTPSAVMEAGFQMSFAATVALVAVFEELRLRRMRRSAADRVPRSTFGGVGLWFGIIVLTALVGSLATAPYAAFHFNRVAPYSVLGNVLAMPTVSFLVMPAGVVSGLALPFGLEAYPLRAMALGIGLVHASAEWVASLPAAHATVAARPPGVLLLVTLALYWAALWRRRWRYWGAVAALAGAVVLAGLHRGPDAYIDRDGAMAAVRNVDGELVFAALRRSGFVVDTWLRRSGDARREEDESLKDIRCKAPPCRAQATTASGAILTIALQMKDEPVAAVCAGADIVLLRGWQWRAARAEPACTDATLISRTQMLRRGAMAVYMPASADEPLEIVGARDDRKGRTWHQP